MIEPNFFIVGAPKCGTTALYSYLIDHPNIFMPEIKEPHFFATDYSNIFKIATLEDYHALFSNVTEQHIAIGEASVHYIHSDEAIYNIYNAYPNAKLIAMLRHPIELLRSLHSMSYSLFNENVEDFEEAWRLQPLRAQGKYLPPNYMEPKFLQYTQIGKLGFQVQRLLETFPREQVKCIFFDDFKEDTKAVYEEVLSFLDVPTDYRKSFEPVNVTGQYKFHKLGRFVEKPPPLAVTIKKHLIGDFNLRPIARKFLKKRVSRKQISQELKNEMMSVFREDIILLGKLLDRNIQSWLDV